MRYYIADQHFYHDNLNQRMARRGFESGEAMNEYMISQWKGVLSDRAAQQMNPLPDCRRSVAEPAAGR